MCISAFITNRWMLYFFTEDDVIYFVEDVRWIGPFSFQALQMFCKSASKTIRNSLIRDSFTNYILPGIVCGSLIKSKARSSDNCSCNYIVTTRMGIVGSLTTALKLFVPRLVKHIIYSEKKWKRRPTQLSQKY